MLEAVRLSRFGYPAPNPRVGCVIVRDGWVVGKGFHRFAGGPHAEAVALQQAGSMAEGADVYVTLEPCAHYGRTPPCTSALVAARVRSVYFAVADPNPKAGGGGELLRAAGIEVHSGLLSGPASAVNKIFLTAHGLGRPFVVLKIAMSLDGRIASATGESRWITGPKSRRAGHKLRAELGCVLVGRGTYEADQPSLTARLPGIVNQPRRVVMGSVADTRDGWTACDRSVPLDEVLSRLFAEGQIGVLVEGGAGVYGSFLKAGIVDQIELFLAPTVLGEGLGWVNERLSGSLQGCPRFEVVRLARHESDVQISLIPTKS